MGKYDKASRRTPIPPRPWKIHPIWRGIGCIWMLLSPVMSYIIATYFVGYVQKSGLYPIPADFLRSITIPFSRYFPIKDLSAPHLYANLLVAGVVLIVGFGVVMVVYAIIYSIMGPKRLGPLDAPEIHRRTRRSR